MTDDVTWLDYAATSAVRPQQVIDAVTDYLTHNGTTPGRGGHRLALEAGRLMLRCRQALAQLLDLPGDPGRVVFTPNATHALNTALRGTLVAGDRVVVTQLDHNAVLRTAHVLAETRGVHVTVVPADASGALDQEELDRALAGARMLCINGASNVLGTACHITDLARRARDAGAVTVLDAAQTAGHVPFSARESGVDIVAITGHKGLLGPQGTGALWVREGLDLVPLVTGGTGGDSRMREMPAAWPDRLEAGTQNGPGIAGLLAGIEWLLQRGVAELHEDAAAFKARMHAGLSALPNVRVLSPLALDGVPIVTFVSDVVDPASLAARLDRRFGILVRAGLHCAPGAHRILGTDRTGAVRASAGWATTQQHVDQLVDAVRVLTHDSKGGRAG